MTAKIACILVLALPLSVAAETTYDQLLARDDALIPEQESLPANASLWRRGELRAKLRRLEADYRSYLWRHPEHAAAHVAFGGFLYDQRRWDEAIQCWEKAIAVDPRCAKAYNNLAAHYGHFGRPADALRYHQKAFELDPSDPIYHFNWATTCIMYRKDAHNVYGWDADEIFRRSQEEFLKARDLEPLNVEFAWAYAQTFYQVTKPDWQAARAAWQFCLDQATDEVGRERVYCNLARVCIKSERLDEARSWLAKINDESVMSQRKALERRLAGTAARPQSPSDQHGGDQPADKQ